MKSPGFFKSGFMILIILLIAGCQSHKKLEPGEGYISVKGGKIWYRVVGEGSKRPILLLHGGPGIPSYYLKPLEALAHDRSLIFFDQLGCGRSDRITDTSLMTIENYIEEVEQVKKYFRLKDYYLYGQSWGTMLGVDYYLKYPKGIKGLILSSPALSITLWMKDADTLISTLPDSIQKSIRTNEKNKTYDAPDYQHAIEIYYQNFLARKLPWSPEIDSSFSKMGENVYKYMGGPSEFTITGSLKNYDRTGRLGEINVPTLLIAGEYDEARPSTVKYYASKIGITKFVVIPNAGHLTMQDQPEQYNRVISEFVTGVEDK